MTVNVDNTTLPIVNPELWYQSNEVIAAFIGAALAFFLVMTYDWLRARRRRRAHFSALKAEIGYCHDLAKAYLKEGVAAPLYRLPTVAYANSLPALLADAALNHSDTRSLLAFFNEVETLNRGLDQAEDARLIADQAEREVKVDDEFNRNRLKAKHLVSIESLSSPSYYDRAKSVIDSRLRWHRL